MSTPSARSHVYPRVRQANPLAGQLLTRRRRRVLVTGAMTALLAAPIALLPAPALAATPGGIVTWGMRAPTPRRPRRALAPFRSSSPTSAQCWP
jgi:hypothetical protein